MRIAILGWGSLIWNPDRLEHDGRWRTGGPVLPIEFSRISPDGRLTLIVDPVHGSPTVTRWSLARRASIEDVAADLAARERCGIEDIGTVDAATGAHSRSRFPEQVGVHATVADWCRRQRLGGAVWTALPATFEARTGKRFSVEHGLSYLDSLRGEPRAAALEYVRNAPPQVASPLRRAFTADPRFAPGVLRSGQEGAMQVQYLEIVTPDVDATCATYARLHGVSFSEPQAGLGNARTAPLPGGGLIGVRAPMSEAEEPVVRPYVLVEDIDAAAKAAQEAGGEIAHPPMEIPGHGKFAIFIQGGIHHGLWQV